MNNGDNESDWMRQQREQRENEEQQGPTVEELKNKLLYHAQMLEWSWRQLFEIDDCRHLDNDKVSTWLDPEWGEITVSRK